MSYSDFTLDALRKRFGLFIREENLFPSPGFLEPSAWLKEALQLGQEPALFSEKSRSEFIVAPVLSGLKERFKGEFNIFSGVWLEVDPDRGLKGESDFILAQSSSIYVLEAPLLVVFEAKKHDIEEGFGQCGAQMVALRLYNDRETHSLPFLYGCVTTGEAWHFLKLQGTELLIDVSRYYIRELGRILWVLAEIIKSFPRRKTVEQFVAAP